MRWAELPTSTAHWPITARRRTVSLGCPGRPLREMLSSRVAEPTQPERFGRRKAAVVGLQRRAVSPQFFRIRAGDSFTLFSTPPSTPLSPHIFPFLVVFVQSLDIRPHTSLRLRNHCELALSSRKVRNRWISVSRPDACLLAPTTAQLTPRFSLLARSKIT